MTETKTFNKKAWLVCLVGILGGISLALVQNKVSPIITVLMGVFEINMSTAGLLSTVFTFVGIIIALPAALILKRFGPKKSSVTALLFAIVGSIIGLATDNITVLIASRVVEGMGIGIIAVVVPTLISMWFPPEKRGLPMGLWVSWMTISQTVLFFSSSFLVESMGWQAMWWIGLILCAISLVLFLFFIQAPPAESNFANAESAEVSIAKGVKSFGTVMVAIAGMCFVFCSFTFVSWIGAYWAATTSMPPETIGMWIALIYFIEIFFTWIVGGLLNKIKNRKRFGAIGFLIYGLIGLAAFTVVGEPILLLFALVYPFFDALVPTTVWTLAPETAKNPIYAGVALGVLNIGLNLGTFLSAPVSGAFVEGYGWIAAGVCFLVASLIGAVALLATKTHTAAPAEPELVTGGNHA